MRMYYLMSQEKRRKIVSESKIVRIFFSYVFVALMELIDHNAVGERWLTLQATLVGIELTFL